MDNVVSHAGAVLGVSLVVFVSEAVSPTAVLTLCHCLKNAVRCFALTESVGAVSKGEGQDGWSREREVAWSG